MPLRVVAASIFIVVFCSLAAWELWRIRKEPLPSLRPAMWTCVAFTAFTLIRIPLVAVVPFPMGALPVDGRWGGRLRARGLYARDLYCRTLVHVDDRGSAVSSSSGVTRSPIR